MQMLVMVVKRMGWNWNFAHHLFAEAEELAVYGVVEEGMEKQNVFRQSRGWVASLYYLSYSVKENLENR